MHSVACQLDYKRQMHKQLVVMIPGMIRIHVPIAHDKNLNKHRLVLPTLTYNEYTIGTIKLVTLYLQICTI